jgi:hypothetical protein
MCVCMLGSVSGVKYVSRESSQQTVAPKLCIYTHAWNRERARSANALYAMEMHVPCLVKFTGVRIFRRERKNGNCLVYF